MNTNYNYNYYYLKIINFRNYMEKYKHYVVYYTNIFMHLDI